MKRKLFKGIIFVLIFAILFGVLQDVLSYKWEQGWHMVSRYEMLREEPQDSIDVIFLGSSPTYRSVSPMVIWNETGVTSMNFGSFLQVSMTEYYIFQYICRYQTPKLLVIEFNHVCLERSVVNNPNTEKIYHSAIETMPDLRIRAEMIMELHRRYPSENMLDYWIPLLRYHSRWSELIGLDFRVTNQSTRNYRYELNKGIQLMTKVEPQQWPEEYFSGDSREPLDYYIDFYQRIVDECREKGIEVMIITYPKMDVRKCDHEAAVEFAEKNGLEYRYFSSKEEWDQMGLNTETDFYDLGHMNALGQRKFSASLAEYIQQKYDLPDHRDNPSFQKWNDDYVKYDKQYRKEMEGAQ